MGVTDEPRVRGRLNSLSQPGDSFIVSLAECVSHGGSLLVVYLSPLVLLLAGTVLG